MSAKKTLSVFHSKKKNKNKRKKKEPKRTTNTCKNITLNKVNSISDLKLWMYCNPMIVMQLFSSVFAFYKYSARDFKTQQFLQNTSESLKELEEHGQLIKDTGEKVECIRKYADNAHQNMTDAIHTAVDNSSGIIRKELNIVSNKITSDTQNGIDDIINELREK